MIQDKQTGISEKMLRRIGQKKGKIEIRRKYKYQTHYISQICLEHAKKIRDNNNNIYPFNKKINRITDVTIIKSPVKVSHHHFLKNYSWHHPKPMEK